MAWFNVFNVLQGKVNIILIIHSIDSDSTCLTLCKCTLENLYSALLIRNKIIIILRVLLTIKPRQNCLFYLDLCLRIVENFNILLIPYICFCCSVVDEELGNQQNVATLNFKRTSIFMNIFLFSVIIFVQNSEVVLDGWFSVHARA